MVPTQDGDLRGFTLIAVLFLLTHSCGGQSNLVSSSQPIVALAGEDVTLSCRLDPPISASLRSTIWIKSGLDNEIILYYKNRQLMHQNEGYRGRTALFEDQLINGNVSLKLSRVKLSDAGGYICNLPSLDKKASIQLIVGVVSTPVINATTHYGGGVTLDCSSVGWYPEPEVLWLDGEGNLLSAGPTETVRGPDDLYTVSSRVTVEKRHSNSFTCRVQQKDTSQTREAQIDVSESRFIRITVIISVVFLFFFVSAVLLWKRIPIKMDEKRKLEAQMLQKELQDLDDKISKLEAYKDSLEALMVAYKLELEEVEEEWREKKGTDMSEKNLAVIKRVLEDKKTQHLTSLQMTESRLQITESDIKMLTQKKKKKEAKLKKLQNKVRQKDRETEDIELNQSEPLEMEEMNTAEDHFSQHNES